MAIEWAVSTDDRMRSHGTMRAARSSCLSPAIDVSPAPGDDSKCLRRAIDYRMADAATVRMRTVSNGNRGVFL